MFHIREVIVTPQQEEHIWTKHHVSVEEVDEVCFGKPLVMRGRDGSYAVYGQTESGRYLLVFLYPIGRGVYSLATARDMQDEERHQYHRSRGR